MILKFHKTVQWSTIFSQITNHTLTHAFKYTKCSLQRPLLQQNSGKPVPGINLGNTSSTRQHQSCDPSSTVNLDAPSPMFYISRSTSSIKHKMRFNSVIFHITQHLSKPSQTNASLRNVCIALAMIPSISMSLWLKKHKKIFKLKGLS